MQTKFNMSLLAKFVQIRSSKEAIQRNPGAAGFPFWIIRRTCKNQQSQFRQKSCFRNTMKYICSPQRFYSTRYKYRHSDQRRLLKIHAVDGLLTCKKRDGKPVLNSQKPTSANRGSVHGRYDHLACLAVNDATCMEGLEESQGIYCGKGAFCKSALYQLDKCTCSYAVSII